LVSIFYNKATTIEILSKNLLKISSHARCAFVRTKLFLAQKLGVLFSIERKICIENNGVYFFQLNKFLPLKEPVSVEIHGA